MPKRMNILLVLLAIVGFSTAVPIATRYGIIMDAGSSGTRIHVYKWLPVDCDKLPLVEKLSSHKVKPGLSSYNERLDEIPDYLEQLIDEASKAVPETSRGATEIALMATAGLRTFAGEVTESLLDAVREFLGDDTRNPFSFNPQNIKVLSGEEEGVYAWVTVNYLLGKFNGDDIDPVGILEMGGGSTQIAFVPDEPVYEGSFRIELGEKQYDLYSQSYLSYGQDYMMSRIEEHLYKKKGSPVNNYCRIKGDNREQEMADGEIVNIRGAWDSAACLKLLKYYTHKDAEEFCHPKPCAIGRVYQPHVGEEDFYAISAFYNAANEISAIREDGVLDMDLLLRKVVKLCSKEASVLASEIGVKEKYLSGDCMMGLYTPLLLHKAYGFPLSTDKIHAAGQINGITAEWTIGAVLDLNNLSNDCLENGKSPIKLSIRRR